MPESVYTAPEPVRARKPKRYPPQEVRETYAAALRLAQQRTGIDSPTLARLVGVTDASIYSYRTARQWPLPEVAAAIGDALFQDSLVELGQWRMVCRECRKEFIVANRGGRERVYCSSRCQNRWHRRLHTERQREHSTNALRIANHENEERRLLILEHCLECAGPGRVCPLIRSCVFIPVTELPKRRRRKLSALQKTG